MALALFWGEGLFLTRSPAPFRARLEPQSVTIHSSISSPSTWTRIIDYLEQVSRRTHETEPVSLNLVIQAGKGTGDVTQPNVQKFLDRLASSLFSFLAVDRWIVAIRDGRADVIAVYCSETVGVEDMTWMEWYNSLAKPSWTPAPATIGLIWQILYPIILVTFGFVFVQTIRRKIPWTVALPFAINLVANLIFTPIQFGMRNLPLAAVDILVVWTTILWMAVAIWRHYRWVAVAQGPVFHLGVAGDGAATEHYVDEPGKVIMKSVNRAEISDLQQIPNIGPSIAKDLRLIGVQSPQDLLGKDPYEMYEALCNTTGERHDPCVIDVFIAAVRFMGGEPAKPWWKYTPERKQTLAAKAENG